MKYRHTLFRQSTYALYLIIFSSGIAILAVLTVPSLHIALIGQLFNWTSDHSN